MSAPESGKLIAVTGGAGFIGSHTVGLLLEHGHRVLVLDNFSTGKRENLAAWAHHPRLAVAELDITERAGRALQEAVAPHGDLHALIHLAAQTSVVRSVEAPLDDIRQNYTATVYVLECARNQGAAKVVFTSSSAVYGDTVVLPVGEDQPPAPLSPYGIHKRASELQLQYYWSVHGVGTTALRLFNVYGPRQDPGSPYSGVISIFLDHALRGEPLLIFGDGEQTRDFVYVGDVAKALVTACFEPATNGAIINIGRDSRLTINALAAHAIQCYDSPSTVAHAPSRAGEIRHSRAAVTRAKELLGFTPETTMETGLAETAAWFKNQGE